MKNLNKMKIAGDMQFEIGQDKVSHFADLSVKDDITLHKKLNDMQHSTFDLSKFTVVGSPTITNDGVASGFSSGNYISIATGVNITNTDFKIEIPFVKTASNTVIVSTTISNSANHSFALIHFNNRLMLFLGTGSTWNIASGLLGTTTCQNNIQYIVKLIRTSTQYILKLLNTKTGIETTEITVENTTDLGNISTLYLGTSSFWANIAYNTIYDLKQFSITVDGKEVFSGNKTGIDTIKPDDYTIVGNPVITDDGVVSGFNANNIMTLPVNQSNLSEFILHFKGKFVVGENNRNIIFTNEQNKGVGKTCFNNIDIQWAEKRIGVTLYIDNVWTSLVTLPTPALNLNDTVEITLTLGMTEQHLKVVLNDTTEYNSTLHLELSPFSIVNPTLSSTSFPWFGNIDLNSIRMYGDGDLIYQPCLKIPYTESKTGSKIVDEVYRDRVIDLYEQTGYTHYYTIGENDFTLATCKGSDVVAQGEAEGIAYTKTADLTLTQRGNCTSGSVVNLLPYKDENSYHVSAPYTAKTNNSFTPSANGDFIAVGKCYL